MEQGMVLYADGGCRPNPGFGGWGVHGYLFSDNPPTKGSGNDTQILTSKGYFSKLTNAPLSKKPKEEDTDMFAVSGDDDMVIGDAAPAKAPKVVKEAPKKRELAAWVKEVTPVHYVDGHGSFQGVVTNNVGELFGMLQAFRHAAQYDIKTLQIFTDSEYAEKGINGRVQAWERNNWLRHDMTPPKNVEYWKLALEARRLLADRGVKVKIDWVRGHNDNYGNERADRLATVGVMKSQNGVFVNEMNTRPADGYWRHKPDRHPFLANRRFYFNSLPESCIPGVYYMGDHGKDDDLLGKRISDGTFAVVRLAEPDPIIELIRNKQCKLAGGTDSIFMGRADTAFHPQTHQEISLYGEFAMWQDSKDRLDMVCMSRFKSADPDEDTVGAEPLTVELRPARLAMRAVESVEWINGKLDQFLQKDKSIIVTDLTPILYETSVKEVKGKEPVTILTLKPEYNVGYAALKVQANYQDGDDVKSVAQTLSLGIDMLDRNALKRLEDLKPVVTLITWLESPGAFRYATVIEASGSVGIWAGVYSNLRFIAEPA